jgi:hypothetical protein
VLDVDSLLEDMPISLFIEWLEYASFRPIGEKANDARAAIVPLMLSGMFQKGRGTKKLEERECCERRIRPHGRTINRRRNGKVDACGSQHSGKCQGADKPLP